MHAQTCAPLHPPPPLPPAQSIGRGAMQMRMGFIEWDLMVRFPLLHLPPCCCLQCRCLSCFCFFNCCHRVLQFLFLKARLAAVMETSVRGSIWRELHGSCAPWHCIRFVAPPGILVCTDNGIRSLCQLEQAALDELHSNLRNLLHMQQV